MIEAEILIRNRSGLHLRPAAMFVQTASRFTGEVFVSHDGTEVNGKSIMGVIMLAAEPGSTIKVKADGPDEKEALAAIAELFEKKFLEEAL